MEAPTRAGRDHPHVPYAVTEAPLGGGKKVIHLLHSSGKLHYVRDQQKVMALKYINSEPGVADSQAAPMKQSSHYSSCGGHKHGPSCPLNGMHGTEVLELGTSPSGQILYSHLLRGTCRVTFDTVYYHRGSYNATDVGNMKINAVDMTWYRSKCNEWTASVKASRGRGH